MNIKSASGIQRRMQTEMSQYSPVPELKRGSGLLFKNFKSQMGFYNQPTMVSRLKMKKNSFQDGKKLQSQYLDKLQSSKTLQPFYSNNETIEKILQHPVKSKQFRDMVCMHLKKEDVSTKVISHENLTDLKQQIILPINSFKQCLQVIGVQLSPEVSLTFDFDIFQQLNKFVVRGDVKQQDQNKSNKTSSMSTTKSSGFQAIISKSGSRILGVNIPQFMNFYM